MKDKVLAIVAALGVAAGTAYFLKPLEGYEPVVAPDPIGIPTSCFGHVGPENTPGRVFTPGECD
jgi:lysozyme